MPDQIAQASSTDHAGQKPAQSTLTIGAPAPSLASVRWIQGAAPQPGTPCVIEFWSPWSGAHAGELSALSEAFPQIRFCSVAVGGIDENAVREALNDSKGSIRHDVGYDATGNAASAASGGSPESVVRDWLEAFGELGLPITFLVDGTGHVCWIGPARKLPRTLADFQAGSLAADPSEHHRRQILQSLEIDPAVKVDESAFENIFGVPAPNFETSPISWLQAPAPKSAEAAGAETAPVKSGGILGRVFGRGKSEPPREQAGKASEQETSADRYGPPRSGRAVALILADVIADRSLEPGWNVLNEPDLNDLPAEFPEVDFVVLIRTEQPLETLFEPEYAETLARWTGEIGWRLGSEVAGEETMDTSQARNTSFIEFCADQANLVTLPAGVLIDPSGKVAWAGSPLLLSNALKLFQAGELTAHKSASDLVFWYRLLASNAANERLAGIAGIRTEGSAGWQGFPADTFETERWAEIIAQLKSQLPWRAHLWSVFEFSLATREARRSGGSTNAAEEIVERFDELSNRFESEFRSMDSERLTDYDYDPLDPWRMTILTAVEYLGLLREGVEPLEGAELFAIETHPLTQAVVDSAKRLEECLQSVPAETLYLPSVWPVLMLRLGHKDDAKKGFEAEEKRFERFLEALRAATADADSVAAAIGADPENYRAVIRNLRALCD